MRPVHPITKTNDIALKAAVAVQVRRADHASMGVSLTAEDFPGEAYSGHFYLIAHLAMHSRLLTEKL